MSKCLGFDSEIPTWRSQGFVRWANGIVLACIFSVFGLQTLPTCSIHRPEIAINFEVWSVFLCVFTSFLLDSYV